MPISRPVWEGWGKTADKDDDRLNRFEALTSQQVQPESL